MNLSRFGTMLSLPAAVLAGFNPRNGTCCFVDLRKNMRSGGVGCT